MGSNIAMVAPDPPGVPRERGALKIIGIWQQNVPYPDQLNVRWTRKTYLEVLKDPGGASKFF